MQGMRDVLRGSLARSLREWRDEDRLAAAWQVACGPALAGHGVPDRLDGDGVLYVEVVDSEWMQPFLSMRSALANDLSRISGVCVSEIHFERQSSAPMRTPASPRTGAQRRKE